MTCIYTGARVHFEEYYVTHAADLHRVGDSIVINCNYSDFYSCHSDKPTHSVVVGSGYMNIEKRIFVVRDDSIVSLEDEPCKQEYDHPKCDGSCNTPSGCHCGVLK